MSFQSCRTFYIASIGTLQTASVFALQTNGQLVSRCQDFRYSMRPMVISHFGENVFLDVHQKKIRPSFGILCAKAQGFSIGRIQQRFCDFSNQIQLSNSDYDQALQSLENHQDSCGCVKKITRGLP